MIAPTTTSGPEGLPRQSWAEALKRTFHESREDQIDRWAAALTFYAVLSIFPALLVMVSVVGLVADPARITQLLVDTIAEFGPESAEQTIERPVESLTAGRGTMLVVGVVTALWTASGWVSAFSDVSNRMYEVEEGRPVWKRKPLQMVVTLVLIVLAAAVALALLLSGPIVAALGSGLGVGETALAAWRLAKWPTLVLLAVLIFVVINYTAPNARVSGARWLIPGAAAFLAIWIVASVLFALYVTYLGAYDRTYGALGGVAVFLLWMWISNIALLVGVELNAELERSRQIRAGVPDADEQIRLEEREPPERSPAAS